MDSTPKPRRGPALLLTLLGVVIVGGILASTLFQRPAPTGKAVLGLELPPKHSTKPCYLCHRGMTPAAGLIGRQPPAKHPAGRCGECHQGYVETPGESPPGAPPTARSTKPAPP